ncbi:MAG: hypothetical protein V1690_00865 [Candidatus Moraniibacteriota bacterium]
MDNNKKIIGLLAVVVVIMLVFLAVLQVKVSNLEKMLSAGNGQSYSLNNPGAPTGSTAPQVIQDKSQIPDTVTGTVVSADASKITVQQNASADLKYVINKSDIKQIYSLTVNPQFDKAKLIQRVKDAQNNTNSSAKTNNNTNAQPDPALSPYISQAASWSSIAPGELVNVQKNTSGDRELYIFPKNN